jgi:hypothetical protein
MLATVCTRWSSSDLLHNALRSGTERELDSTARRARRCSMVRHPNSGQNLVMTGTDRLNGGTDTPVISQRSEAGQVILDAKAGRGMWVCSVLVVLSSRLSDGTCSLVGHRDNVSCVFITVISITYTTRGHQWIISGTTRWVSILVLGPNTVKIIH